MLEKLGEYGRVMPYMAEEALRLGYEVNHQNGEKILAIKEFRNHFGLELKHSKDVIDYALELM